MASEVWCAIAIMNAAAMTIKRLPRRRQNKHSPLSEASDIHGRQIVQDCAFYNLLRSMRM
jgi:hypothetical protein